MIAFADVLKSPMGARTQEDCCALVAACNPHGIEIVLKKTVCVVLQGEFMNERLFRKACCKTNIQICVLCQLS